MREINDYTDAAREFYGPCADFDEEEAQARKQEGLRKVAEKAVFDPKEPASILMSLVIDEGLAFGTAQSIYQRVYGADCNLQDAAERENA
jgi:hypothetical protein